MRKITVKHDNYMRELKYDPSVGLFIDPAKCAFAMQSGCAFGSYGMYIAKEDLIDCYEVDVRGGKVKLKYLENKKEFDHEIDLLRYAFMPAKVKTKDRNTDLPKELEINGEKFVKEEKKELVTTIHSNGKCEEIAIDRSRRWMYTTNSFFTSHFTNGPLIHPLPVGSWFVATEMLKDGMVIDVSDGTLKIK